VCAEFLRTHLCYPPNCNQWRSNVGRWAIIFTWMRFRVCFHGSAARRLCRLTLLFLCSRFWGNKHPRLLCSSVAARITPPQLRCHRVIPVVHTKQGKPGQANDGIHEVTSRNPPSCYLCQAAEERPGRSAKGSRSRKGARYRRRPRLERQ